jgi:uncharacterized protein (TIGR00251 family)
MKIDERHGSVFLRVKAVPNASRTAIAGILGDALKIAVAQPPEAGKANAAILELLAATFNLPLRNVRVVAGSSHSRKTVELAGTTRDAVTARIAALPK